MNKAVIFDLDGVLIDACEWHYFTLNSALQELYNYTIPEDEHNTLYNGLPTRTKVNMLINHGKLASTVDVELIQKTKEQHIINYIKNHVTIDIDKQNLIMYLKWKGFKIGCYTNQSNNDMCELFLRTAGLYHLFDAIVNASMVNQSKPHPEGYLLCMNKLESTPESTIIIEDSPYGIQAAKSSRARVIEVPNAQSVTLKYIRGLI